MFFYLLEQLQTITIKLTLQLQKKQSTEYVSTHYIQPTYSMLQKKGL